MPIHHNTISRRLRWSLATLVGTAARGWRTLAAFCLAVVLVLGGREIGRAERPSISILAGSGRPALVNGAGAKAAFNEPFGICLDAKGALYVADSANHCVRKVSPDGVVFTCSD